MTCVLLVASAAACGGDGGGDHNPGALFPDRANQYREDQERDIGGSAMLGGYTATVTDAQLVEGERTIQVDVDITNRDKGSQRVDATHWTLVDPQGHTIEASGTTMPWGDLAGGATVTGSVMFTVDPEEAGDYYIQYKPETLDAARGIWQLTVS
jgi:hypothetical protein